MIDIRSPGHYCARFYNNCHQTKTTVVTESIRKMWNNVNKTVLNQIKNKGPQAETRFYLVVNGELTQQAGGDAWEQVTDGRRGEKVQPVESAGKHVTSNRSVLIG